MIFKVIYKLLDDLNLLNKASKDESKITLLEEYPDEEYEEDTFVIYSVGKEIFSAIKVTETIRLYVNTNLYS